MVITIFYTKKEGIIICAGRLNHSLSPQFPHAGPAEFSILEIRIIQLI
jgi:hypothetical protein